jgi:hypothetical protein
MKLKVHITYGFEEQNLRLGDIKEASSTTWLLTCTNPNYLTIVPIGNNMANSKIYQVTSCLLQFVCSLSYA